MTKTTRSNSTNLSAITKRCLTLKLKELILYMAIFEKLLIISFFGKVLSSPNQTVHRSFLIKLKMSVDIIGKRIVLMI